MKTIGPVNRLPAISRTALRTAVSVVLALTALAGCDKASGLEFDDDTPQGMVTIAALKSRCTGAQAAVTEDITVEGVVTGNDLYGEFYKTLVVEDTSVGNGGVPSVQPSSSGFFNLTGPHTSMPATGANFSPNARSF